jgi:hypothetical protein
VWRSLIGEAVTWLTFYVLNGLLLGGSGYATFEAVRRMGLLAVLPIGPLWAACVFVFARLLGRLAWRIMQPGEQELREWRKVRQTTLAAELRQQERETAESED